MHAVLQRHCARYCGAQNLAVVLIGAEPLPKLQRMVADAFSAVPRAPEDAPDYSQMPLPFDGVASPRRYRVKCILKQLLFSPFCCSPMRILSCSAPAAGDQSEGPCGVGG